MARHAVAAACLLAAAVLIGQASAEYFDPSSEDPTYNSKQHLAAKYANVSIVNFTPHRNDIVVGAAYMLHHRCAGTGAAARSSPLAAAGPRVGSTPPPPAPEPPGPPEPHAPPAAAAGGRT
jgi:hypothetical protein